MKVKKITVKNFKAISDMEADFNGCTAIITGGNNKGKSTFLKSFIDRIHGEKQNNIIKKGETSGYCEYELTDGSKFVWEINDKGREKLSYITSEGVESKIGIVKEIGNRMFGVSFDIDEFLQSQPKKQKEILQKVLGINILELEKEHEDAYNNRTAKHTILKNETARCEGLEINDEKLKRIDLKQLQEELIVAEKANANYKYIAEGVKDKENQVLDIDKQIKNLMERKDKLSEEISKGNKWLETNTEEVDVKSIREKILRAEEINSVCDLNDEARKQIEKMNLAKEAYDYADKQVKEVDEKKAAILKAANVPEGFEFTETGLKYNGFDLDKKQLSSSSIYIASLKLASMSIGDIKTLCFDASYLDKESLMEIEKWASDKGLQLLIERPDYDGGELRYEIFGE